MWVVLTLAAAAPAQNAPPERLPVPLPAPADHPLTFLDLLALAQENNPELAIARARVQAARGRFIQAGLYLNPTITWESEQISHRNGGNEGPIIAQDIITGRKRQLAQAAAAQGVVAADWQAMTRYFDVLTRLRLAYFEVLTAQRTVETNREVMRIAQEGLDVARKLYENGQTAKIDVIRAQVELEQNRVQLMVANQRLEAAWKLLAVAVGIPALPCRELAGNLETSLPDYEWQPAREVMLGRSSEVQATEALVLQAERLLDRARAENIPDLQLSVRPLYAFADKTYETTAMIGVTLPIFNRNQGNIQSAVADAARSRDEVRQTELRLTDLLARAFQRYLSARQQIDTYQKQILPGAQESLRLVRLGYEKGDAKYDYTAVLQAQRTLIQARLIYVQALGEAWQAVSDIAGLLQQDESKPGCEK